MDEPFGTGTRAATRQRAQTRALIGLGLGAFGLGALAVWILAGTPGLAESELFLFKSDEPAAVVSPAPSPVVPTQRIATADERVEAMAEQQGGLDQRVAAMEQRLARLDLQTQAAAGNAARAEGLLVTFATRRAIERGAPLGYLADQLRLRFGDAQPNAVRTVIEASQRPVTLDQLLARLDGLAPELGETAPSPGVLSWISRQLEELFVVRREDAPSPAPERRMERARLFLESGRAEAAVSEVRNLPNAAEAAEWIADAQRYAVAQRALELLETTALLEPRQLRNASGETVQQPSPVAGD